MKTSISPKIALVTDRERPDLSPDDQLLVPVLRDRGFEVFAEQWDSKTTDWNTFDLCILRSCWDYHLRVSEFLQWLRHLEERGVRVMNPVPTVRWNHNKRYLKDLEERGIPIVPTFVANGNSDAPLGEIMRVCGWNEVIVKPCVSAAAYRTHRVAVDDAGAYQDDFKTIARDSGALVQPFLREVQSAGELSFMFFDRTFSHAVLKKPLDGEYRSQELFGGISMSADPENVQIEAATKVIAEVGGDLLYARVDMIQVDGRLLLGELELIEPSLFFMHDPESPSRFGQKLSRWLGM